MPAEGGIRFGQYVLLRRIARGGMAEVFLAQQRGLEGFDRRVAVKRILPHLSDSPDFIKMFLGEAKLAAQLTHPNIVHIYDFGKVEDDYFIAMEFVDGVHAGQLFKHVEREALPPTLVARIGADAATALHYAHDLRGPSGKPIALVHRDVSPANIMVSFDGVVKLCDFGIAKAAALSDQLTNPGQVKGKYAYMSPEQTVAQPLDGRSDVFSLAIVLWELLAGKVIVPRGDAIDAMRAIRDGKLEPIDRAAPGVPPPLAKAVTWALQTKRDQRASAGELAQALEAFIKSAPELGTSMQLGEWIRARFPREGTGQLNALAPNEQGPGTAPGTVSVSDGQSPLTPPAEPSVTGARNVPLERGAPSQSGTHLYERGFGSELDEEAAPTHKRRSSPRPRVAVRGDATLIDENPRRPAPADEVTLRDRAEPVDNSATVLEPPRVTGEASFVTVATEPPSGVHDTLLADATATATATSTSLPSLASSPSAARVVPVPASGARSLPSAGQPSRASSPPAQGFDPRGSVPPSGPRALPQSGIRAPGSGPRQSVGVLETERSRREPPPGSLAALARRINMRTAATIAGLVGLALISFSIALCASGSRKPAGEDSALAPADAATITMVATMPADATAPDAAPPTPTFAADAMPTTLFVVKTIPPGGTVRVGEQGGSRVAPAEFALIEGTYEITAELAGYQSEHRTVEVPRGERYEIEIAFTKRTASGVHLDRGPPTSGMLTVSTQPYSDVYEGSRLLGETPLADLPLSPGSHTLTFKNPKHPTITKTVTITAGKTVKLSFALP